MFYLFISIILVIISAISNAIMDTIKHHWKTSIFKNIENKKLYKFFHKEGWKHKYVDWDNGDRRRVKWNLFGFKFNKPIQLTDAWHLFKSIMLTCLLIIGGLYVNIIDNTLFNIILNTSILGFVWIITFNLFYNEIFSK